MRKYIWNQCINIIDQERDHKKYMMYYTFLTLSSNQSSFWVVFFAFWPFSSTASAPNFVSHYIHKHRIFQFVAFAKGPISSFISHFLKNKKHTNFNRCLHLYAIKKLNKKKSERRSLYKPKLSHFTTSCEKSPLRQNASRKKAFNIKTLLVTMAILISFWSSRNPQSPYCSNHRKGKRARAFFRWIWGIFQELNSLPSSRKCDTVAKKIGSFWICNFACKNARRE